MRRISFDTWGDIIAAVLIAGLIFGLAWFFSGCGGPPPAGADATPCSKFVGQPARTGSIYYEHQGIAVNLPAGDSCAFPDGTEVSADK